MKKRTCIQPEVNALKKTAHSALTDILQAKSSGFKEGRFNYVADQTAKSYSINVLTPAQIIIVRYFGNVEYLFPLFTWCHNSKLFAFENETRRLNCKSSCTTIVNKALKGGKKPSIKNPLSTHNARYTFARIAIDKVHNPMVTMEFLAHTSLKVHQQHLKNLRNDQVLDELVTEIFKV